jgi:hypothetical protein
VSDGDAPCRRAAEAARDHALAALLDDEAHLQGCAECRAALAGLQRLTGAIAELSASARRRGDHVARVLAANAADAQAAAVDAEAIEAPDRGVRAAPILALRRRARFAAPVAAVLALAAGLALVWWVRRDPIGVGPSSPPARFAYEVIAARGPVLRGDASLGDRLRVTVPHGTALWIYRNDHELLLVCPRDCRASLAELPLDTIGRYQLVWLSTDRVPAPTGELERDIATARAAGATHQLRDLDVQ